MKKTYNKYKMIATFTVEVPVYVTAKSKQDAFRLCEEEMSDAMITAYCNGTVGLEAPDYGYYSDEDDTPIFEVEESEYDGYDLRFTSTGEEPEEVELEFDDDEFEEDEE